MNHPPNPYAPPLSQDAPVPGSDANLVDASRGRRLLNLIIDHFARTLLGMAAGLGMGAAGIPIHQHVLLFTFGFTLLSYLVYYVVCEAVFGVTIGKLITGTRVVDNEGRKPRLAQIVGRSLARFVPFEPFSFFGTPALGWHDRWSGTRVIRTR
jgi:uncharacterized RDD family membrane protein YckC